jgi:dephospho-CoA kinase
MHIIGILGGVASGKSAIARRLAELGAEVLDGDVVAHEVLREDDVKQAIRDRFGDCVFDQRGEIVRGELAKIVFANDKAGARALADLEFIMHPRIGQRLRERIEQIQRACKAKAIVLDAAVLLKAGWGELCTKILYVDVPRPLRIERAKARGWTAADVDARDARQSPLDVKRAAADVVIDNSGDLRDTFAEVDQFWATVH